MAGQPQQPFVQPEEMPIWLPPPPAGAAAGPPAPQLPLFGLLPEEEQEEEERKEDQEWLEEDEGEPQQNVGAPPPQPSLPPFFGPGNLLTRQQIVARVQQLPPAGMDAEEPWSQASLRVLRPINRLLCTSATAAEGMKAIYDVYDISPRREELLPKLTFLWAMAILRNRRVAQLLLTDDMSGRLLDMLLIDDEGYSTLGQFAEVAAVGVEGEDMPSGPQNAPMLEEVAPIIDDGWLWMLKYAYARSADIFLHVLDPYLHHLFFLATDADTAGEYIVGGPLVPVPKTKRWLAQLTQTANMATFRRVSRERGRSRCLAMEMAESKLCNNPEGNQVGTSWCAIPGWAYYIEPAGYCYDIRELIQHVANQLAGDAAAGIEPTQPSFPFTRQHISPQLLDTWTRTMLVNRQPVPWIIWQALDAYSRYGNNLQFPVGVWTARNALLNGELERELVAAEGQNRPPLPFNAPPATVARRRLSLATAAAAAP